MNSTPHQPESASDQVMRALLFTKVYEFETRLTPEECASHLKGLAQETEWAIGKVITTVNVYFFEKTPYRFNVRMRRRTRSDWSVDLTNTDAAGMVAVKEGTNSTLVRFTVKLGILSLISAVVATLIAIYFFVRNCGVIGATSGGGNLLLFLLVVLVVAVYYWWQVLRDRNVLANLIRGALTDSVSKRS